MQQSERLGHLIASEALGEGAVGHPATGQVVRPVCDGLAGEGLVQPGMQGGQVGYVCVATVVLGWARGKTGSLAPPILLHSAGNAVLKLAALVL